MDKNSLQHLLTLVAKSSVPLRSYSSNSVYAGKINLISKNNVLTARATDGYVAISGTMNYTNDKEFNVWVPKEIARLSLFFPKFSLNKLIDIVGAEEIEPSLDIDKIIKEIEASPMSEEIFNINPTLLAKLTNSMQYAQVTVHEKALSLKFTHNNEVDYRAAIMTRSK